MLQSHHKIIQVDNRLCNLYRDLHRFTIMLKFLVVAMVIALSILLYHEVSHDVLLAKKSVALRGSQSDAFRYVSEMKNYPKVSTGR